MRIIVMGGGLIGVTTGYYLAREGHEVVVLERNDGPGEETSFQNGALLAAGHSQSWAAPGATLTLLKSLFERDPALRFRFGFDARFWSWAMRFLAQCTHERYRANTLRTMRCMSAGHAELKAVCQETGIDHLGNDAGILYLFRNAESLEERASSWTLLTDHGYELQEVGPSRCVEIEPALGPSRSKIAGGFFAPNEGSGDAFKFTCDLATYAKQHHGLRIESGTSVKSIRADPAGGRVEAVVTDKGEFAGDAYVLALGAYSPEAVRPLGIRLPIWPVKGYTVSVSTEGYEGAPTVGLIDEDNLVAFARMGNRLRIGGKADFAGYDTSYRPTDYRGVFKVATDLFPNAADYYGADYWACLRPVTPGGPPILGASPVDNLYLNVGHGSAGWTMGCATARAVADIICNARPALDMEGLEYR